MPTVQTRTSKAGVTIWYVRFRADGVQTSLVFDIPDEARQFALDVEQRGGQWAADNYWAEQDGGGEPTLAQWAERWLDTQLVSPGTLNNYRRDWTQRWDKHLGHMRLSAIRREHIVRALKAQTGADKTIANAWGTLAGMLKTAANDGLLDRSPAAGVKLPKRTGHEKQEHRYLTVAEQLQIITDTHEHYRPLLWMLIGTGMRWSEATALTAGDVDLDAATVRVTKAWKEDRSKSGPGRWYIGPPKTAKSRRTITLPSETVDAVRPLVQSREPGDLLFTNLSGGRISNNTFHTDHWRTRTAHGKTRGATASIAAPKPRIHDLRHSHVATLIAAGCPLPVIQARLGHEKITTTIDTYGHLLPDLQQAAADAASAVFRSAAKPKKLKG